MDFFSNNVESFQKNSLDFAIHVSPILEVVTTLLISIITAYLTVKVSSYSEKQLTARKIFEDSNFKIFQIVEPFLFSKEITLQKTRDLGHEIQNICNQSSGYFHPSINSYARRLIESNKNNFLENWLYFSDRFSMRYDKNCKQIGIPLRNSAYRLNNRQYKNKWQLFWQLFKNEWPAVLSMLFLIYLSFFLLRIKS